MKKRREKKTASRKAASLKTKQLSAFLLSFIMPSFFLIILLFIFFINTSMSFYAREQQNTLDVLSSHLTNTINSNLEMSLAYIFDDDIYHFYNFLSRMDKDEDIVAFNQYLRSYSKAVSTYMTLLSPNIMGMGFLPVNKNQDEYFYIEKYHKPQVLPASDSASLPWYQQLADNSTNVIFTNTSGDLSDHSLSLIRMAKNIDMKKDLGYIVVDVSMDFLYDLLDDLSISEHSGILLFSPMGEFLFSTNDTLTEYSHLLTPDQSTLSCNGDTYNIYSYKDDSEGFTFYYLSSTNDLIASYAGAFLLILIFYTLMAGIALLLFHYNSRQINRSVSPILETMAKYRGGDSEILCNTEQCCIAEFSVISHNLNDMIQKVNDHIAMEYKLQIEQKIAEYQALQAEVDPHFLYNTLNLFITLNRIGEKEELERAIVSLSHLFRYTCEHTANSTVEKEFAFISDYLYLQKIRFDDRLSFQIYLEPGLEHFAIPKLLVQPLVENAIVHGLEPSDQSVTIQISAITAHNKNGLHFTVLAITNTGLPFIEKNIIRKRVGLKNIEERLHIFSPDSFFIIGGGENKPTKCYIVIPSEKRKENYADITC